MEELSTCYKYSYDDYHMLNSIIILENFHWRVVRVFCMIICLVVIFVSTLFFVKYQRFDSVCNIILAVIFAILFLSINRVIEFVEKIKWRCGLFREHRITFTFYLNMFIFY